MRILNKGGDTTKTVEMAFQILEHLRAEDGATLSELTEEFGRAKSTIHRHLYTLECLEFVIKEGSTYYPSLRFLDFGEYVQSRKEAYELAGVKIEMLAQQTDERAQFLVEEHGKGVIVHRATGSNAVQTDPGLAQKTDLHTTAAGKAILACLSREHVERVISHHGLPARTKHSITTPDELLSHLETVRERGYSTNEEESTKGVRAVGVPIRGADGRAIGAVSISGPAHRLTGSMFQDKIPSLLLGAANEIELNINSSS